MYCKVSISVSLTRQTYHGRAYGIHNQRLSKCISGDHTDQRRAWLWLGVAMAVVLVKGASWSQAIAEGRVQPRRTRLSRSWPK